MRRRRWRLERWLAAWLLALTLLGSATGCELICAAGACYTCLADKPPDDGSSPLFTESLQDGQEVFGPVPVSLSITPDGMDRGIVSLDVLLNGALQTVWTSDQPETIEVTPTGDSHDAVFTFVARTAAGDGVESKTSTIVWHPLDVVELQACVADSCTPLDGQTVSGIVTIRAALSADTGFAQDARYAVDDTLTGSDDTQPYEVDIDFGAFPSGGHLVRATVDYNGGEWLQTAQANVTIP